MFILVSAVITTKNRLEDLKRAIDSVLGQSYSDIECIVVSDGSTDGTIEYCESRQDIKFINISPEDSKGGNYARNLGIKAARGKYVAFLDDDDYWMPNKISKQVELIEQKNCGCVYCLRQLVYIEKDHRRIVNESDKGKQFGDISKSVFHHGFTSTSCLLVSKNYLNKVGNFDEDCIKLQEYDLLIRLAQITPIYFVDEPLVSYTINHCDTNRISGAYYRLPIAKKFLETKHKALLRALPLKDYLLYKESMCHRMYNMAKKEYVVMPMIKYFLPYYLSRIIRKFVR